MIVVSATPRAQNEAEPTASVTNRAPSRDHGTATPNRIRPSAVTSTNINSAVTIAFPIRPAMNTQLGSGVPRSRFRIPPSRRMVRLIARLTVVADTTARVITPGTK